MLQDETFNPDWVSHPSGTLLSMMERQGLTDRDLANILQKNLTFAQQLIDGTRRLDPSTARTLSLHLGGSPDFWLKRQEIYETAIASAARKSSDDLKNWISDLPIRQMQKLGWIESASTREGLVQACISFFATRDIEGFPHRLLASGPGVGFRQSRTFKSNRAALAAWVRRGEIQARRVRVRPWSKSKAVSIIGDLRKLSKISSPARFIPVLIALLAEAGIALVIVPSIPGCFASGAARMLDDGRATIILSIRFKTDDHFWFTLFHEIGHLILHEAMTYIDEETGEGDECEEEANRFAQTTLVPFEAHSEMMALPPRRDAIIRFAVRTGTTPGIVVGQMQYHRCIGYHQFNFLKRRFDVNEVVAAAANASP